MTSTQRFLANNRNALLNAALAATSVATIADAVLERPLARGGSARVALSGAYTGHEEANYEIEIIDKTVTTPLISQPIFSGAGTGAISAISFTGTAQEFTVKLADLGQVLTASGTDIEGASLVARTSGAAGNLIHLSVDQSGLVFTNTDYSLIAEIKLGTDGIEGPQFDWDTKVMGADGQIPANAHRLVLGDDTSTVYRQYKKYQDGKWLYHFDPQLKNDFPAGARVKFVTGSRVVTISNGTATETYTGIVTLYDLLSAIQTASALLKVEGVVANDRAPGGMSARDLTTRTDAHCLPSSGSGSASATGLINCAALPAAYTELIEAKCWAVTSKDSPDAGIGRELWQVKGSVSGLVATALKTGVPFSTGQFALTIPTKLPDGFGVQRGRFSQTGISYAARDTAAGETEPPICVKQSLALGPEAVDQTLTLTYKQRPAMTDCSCEGMSVPDLSGRECLTGKINLNAEGETTMTPAQMGRLSRIGAWHRDFVEGNTELTVPGTELNYAANDIKLAGLAYTAFESCLSDIYTSGVLAWAAWAASTATPRYTIVQVGDDRLQAKIAGTTGATAPAVPALEGGTVVDGTVTWVYLGKTPETMWDTAMDSMELILADISTLVPTIPALTVTYINNAFNPVSLALNDLFSGPAYLNNSPIWVPPVFVPDSNNMGPGHWTQGYYTYGLLGPSSIGYIFKATGTGFTTADFMRIVLPNQAPAIGDVGIVQTSLTGDAPNGVPGVWTNHGTCVVDSVLSSSSDANINNSTVEQIEEFSQRYTASMDAIRAAAGIAKKADASTVVAGDGCWRDTGAAFWWEITGSTGGAYAPAFTNEPYFSCRDAGNGYFSTHEFAFQINIKCEASLKVGDTLTLSIGDAGWPSTYQVGDTLYLPVIAAQDLYLAGGKDGDNIQTWYVDGSVDGAFPPYLIDLDIPLPYSALGLGFALTAGGIPFEAGDLFKFTVEGGHYKWRKDAGAWSASAAIPAASAALSDGLSATFTTGAAPSFAANDLYSFRALQPSALSNVVNPDVECWKWSGATATLTANLGGVKTIDCAALSFHSLPSGATVTLYGSADGITWSWSEAIAWRAGVMAKLFASHTATYLKFEISGATGGTIGWAWAGQALSTEYSAECLLRRDYSVERGAGLNPSAAFLGATRSGEVEWQQGILTDTDMPNLLAMLDHLKTNDDEPMILIPQSTRPEEAYPVRVLIDSVDMPEDGGYQPNTGNERRYGMKLSVKGVVA